MVYSGICFRTFLECNWSVMLYICLKQWDDFFWIIPWFIVKSSKPIICSSIKSNFNFFYEFLTSCIEFLTSWSFKDEEEPGTGATQQTYQEGQSKGVSARCSRAFHFLLVVGKKLVTNPNIYACLIGLIWALVSFRYWHGFTWIEFAFSNWNAAVITSSYTTSLAGGNYSYPWSSVNP